MKILDKHLNSIMKNKKQNQKCVNLSSLNIVSLNIANIWENIEYLSLSQNCIKSITFLQKFPNLFYLNLSNNPIESYEIFNKFNSFGYLSLTPPESFLEKQILTIKKINCVILNLPIKNEETKNKFISNNPNILIFNDRYMNFESKLQIMKEELNLNINRKTNILNKNEKELSLIFLSAKNEEVTQENEQKTSQHNQSEEEIFKDKFTLKMGQIQNKLTLKFIDEIKEYNEHMIHIINKKNTLVDEVIFLKEILTLEKENLILISQNFQYIFNIKNNTDHSKFVYTFLNTGDISSQYLILSCLILYILGVISKKFCFALLFGLFKEKLGIKDKEELLSQNINKCLNFEIIYLICFYFEILEKFIKNCEKLNDINPTLTYNSQIKKANVELYSLINHISEITEHKKFTEKLFNFNQQIETKTNFIYSHIIYFLKNVNVYQEIISIVQFINDYLIYNKYENDLALHYSKDLELFQEVKNLLFKSYPSNEHICDKIFNNNQNKISKNKWYFKSSHFLNNIIQNKNNSNVLLKVPIKKSMYTLFEKPPLDTSSFIFNQQDQDKIQKVNNVSSELINYLKIKNGSSSKISFLEDEDYISNKSMEKNYFPMKIVKKNKEKLKNIKKIFLSQSMKDIINHHQPIFPYLNKKITNKSSIIENNSYSANTPIHQRKLSCLLTFRKKNNSESKPFIRKKKKNQTVIPPKINFL